VSKDRLAGNEVHILKLSVSEDKGVQYRCVPSLAREGDDTPNSRAGHSTCVIDNKIIMFGGYGDAEKKEPLKEKGRVWIFDPATLEWTHLDAINKTFPVRYDHATVAHGQAIIIHGGFSTNDASHPETDTWSFSLATRTWTELSALNTLAGSALIHGSAPPNFAIANEKLYLISGTSDLTSQIHILDLAAEAPIEWTTLEFPTNPLTPGPRPRKGAGLIPIKTGWGRTYLLLMLGAKDGTESIEDAKEELQFWSGLWTLQLPSTEKTPASAKDVARKAIGAGSGEAEWAEVEIVPREELVSTQGKSHPGPRAYFASAAVDGKKVICGAVSTPKARLRPMLG